MNNIYDIEKTRVNRLYIIEKIFSLIKAFSFIIVPLIFSNKIKYKFLILIGIFILFLIYSTIYYFLTSYEVKDGLFLYKKGIVIKREDKINLVDIQTIDTSSNLLHQIFSLHALDIGILGKTIKIKCLSGDDINRLMIIINHYRSQKQNEEIQIVEEKKEERYGKDIFSMNIKQLIFYSFLKINIVTGVLVVLSSFFKILDWVDKITGKDNFLIKNIESYTGSAAPKIYYSLVSIVALIISAVVLMIFVSIIITIIKYNGFIIRKHEGNIVCKYGLLNRKTIVINEERIQRIDIVRPLKYRIFNLGKLEVVTLVSKVSEDLKDTRFSTVLIPVANIKKIEAFVKQYLDLDIDKYSMQNYEKQSLRARYILYRWSLFYTAIVAVILSLIVYIIPNIYFITDTIKFYVVSIIVIIFFIESILVNNFSLRKTKVAFHNENNKILQYSTKKFEEKFSIASSKKIGVLTIKENIFLKKKKLCHIDINFLGVGADMKLKYYENDIIPKLRKWYAGSVNFNE